MSWGIPDRRRAKGVGRGFSRVCASTPIIRESLLFLLSISYWNVNARRVLAAMGNLAGPTPTQAARTLVRHHPKLGAVMKRSGGALRRFLFEFAARTTGARGNFSCLDLRPSVTPR